MESTNQSPTGDHTALEQGTQAWLDARKGIVTGSRIAGILGHSPYSNYEKVMDEMLRQHHGLEPRFKGNVATDWGTEHEPDARGEYEASTGFLVNETGFHVHPDHPFIGCSPDGLVMEDGIKVIPEFKCPYSGNLPVEPPQYYIDQCQMNMWVLDTAEAHLFYWTEEDCRLFKIDMDIEWQNASLPVIEDFIADFNKRKDEEYIDFIDVSDFNALTLSAQLVDLRHKIKALQIDEKALAEDLKEYVDPKHDTMIGNVKAIHVKKAGNFNANKMKKAGLNPDDFRNKPLEYVMLKEIK